MFNKKLEQRIERLEKQFITTCQGLTEIRDELKKPRCFEYFDDIPENTYLKRIGEIVKAIKNYLELDFEEDFIEDESVGKSQAKMVRILRAYKKVKNNPNPKIREDIRGGKKR